MPGCSSRSTSTTIPAAKAPTFDPVLEVFARARHLPTHIGIDAFAPLTDDASAALVELSGPLGDLDVVLADPRPGGVAGTGSQRLRIHAVDVPRRLAVAVDDGLADTDGGIRPTTGGFPCCPTPTTRSPRSPAATTSVTWT